MRARFLGAAVPRLFPIDPTNKKAASAPTFTAPKTRAPKRAERIHHEVKAITRGTRSPAQKQLARSVFLLVGVLIGLAVGAMFQAAVPVEYIKLISLIGIAAAALLLLYLLEALRP